ncbi:helicase MOV-10 [Bombina bombina]|uniref:helicase MOV-10 n=1 Tax=Bombina bombina TaxID=8345 RepID=UPI00235A8B80|nr:helicase MOV-10 [Bombina bombina]
MRKAQRQEPETFQRPMSYTKGQARALIQLLKSNRSEFISSKRGVDVISDYDLDNGRIRFRLSPSEPKTFPISIENTSNEPVLFVQYKALRRMRGFSFQDENQVSRTEPLQLMPGYSYKIMVHCSVDSYGYFPITMAFEFIVDRKSFVIGRFLSAVCNSKLADELAPKSAYVPYQRSLLKPIVRNEDEGFPPDSTLTYELEREIPLTDCYPPGHLKASIRAGVFSSKAPVTRSRSSQLQDRDLLASPMDFNNYKERFQLMLYLEEIQMEIDIRRYDQKDKKMELDRRNKRLLVLDVPGVAENRPSVLRGDHLFVTFADERDRSDMISYKGYVHGVELERVRLGFSNNLLKKFVSGLLFDVNFTFNRMPLKVQHRAVHLAKEKNLKEFLFPSCSYKEKIVDPEKLNFFDRSLESNKEQYNAVNHIVCGLSRPAPYLLFGPPGTGKTMTLVEAIKQVFMCVPDSHVLACAPSNSAADLLCQRLMKHMNQKDLFRMLASSRDIRAVPEEIKKFCNWDSDKECFIYPSKEKLMKYKVIVTTLITSGRLVSANFPSGHFTHVFIDESGHAVEPECVTTIAGILNVMERKTNKHGGQLVLAGDPKQLGPILRSPVAKENGLDISLLERLMTQNPLYKKDENGYNSMFVTKLLKNYRSHPDILRIPNELFYENELQVAADELVSNSYCNWDTLPRKGFPIIFHGVLGKDEREGNSPSFFNVSEIQEVITYLDDLLQSQGKKGLSRISPKEIGIISPYRKQVEKIREAIRLRLNHVTDIKELKVGSVEEFQGQERKVIIISTVRSCQDYVKFDEDFNLGFLNNPKRFNVAITRAKALLILVGNPIVLQKDPNWSRFLKFCQEKGGYKGFNYVEEDPLDENDINDLLSSLNINGPPAGEDTGESVIQQQEEPSWRHEH